MPDKNPDNLVRCPEIPVSILAQSSTAPNGKIPDSSPSDGESALALNKFMVQMYGSRSTADEQAPGKTRHWR
jgi:hypothetical protein